MWRDELGEDIAHTMVAEIGELMHSQDRSGSSSFRRPSPNQGFSTIGEEEAEGGGKE
jgi:hypothetical protein